MPTTINLQGTEWNATITYHGGIGKIQARIGTEYPLDLLVEDKRE